MFPNTQITYFGIKTETESYSPSKWNIGKQTELYRRLNNQCNLIAAQNYQFFFLHLFE